MPNPRDNLPEIKYENGYAVIDNVRVELTAGLCCTPSALFTKECYKYAGDIIVENKEDGRRIDPKSITALLTLAASKGKLLKISVQGERNYAEDLVLRLYSGVTTEDRLPRFDRYSGD